MNYRQFNHNVYSYYLDNLILGEFNTLTIPKSDFEDIIQDEKNIQSFNDIKVFDWSLLLNYDGSVPKYFGLLALQCYAAFYMQNDGRLTATNFRDRFIALTGIASTQSLNQLFSETYNNQLNIQEKIWLHAKSFLEKKNIFLEIPKPKSHAGRYTQFPESQCVLNYEDLKEYRNFYNLIYSNYESIHYDDFILEYKKYRPRLISQFTRENNLRILTENEEKIKRRQFFDFYNSMDWLMFEPIQPRKKILNEDYIAKLEANLISIFNEDFEIFDNYNYLLDKNKLAVFSQNEVYKSEYVKCDTIALETTYVILTVNETYINFLENFGGKEVEILNNSMNVKAIVVEFTNEIPTFLSSYQKKVFPVRIIGKKISSKRQFLLSNLPRLESINNITYRLYCDNKRLIYNQPEHTGIYMIKVNGYTSYKFEVIPETTIQDKIEESEHKLNLTILEYDSRGQMYGLGILPIKKDNEEKFSINQWIKTITNEKQSIKTSKYILINAINQHKNGKHQ